PIASPLIRSRKLPRPLFCGTFAPMFRSNLTADQRGVDVRSARRFAKLTSAGTVMQCPGSNDVAARA
ncbi:MAG: hypothetical protein WBW26_02915, partial [Bradyrhizobium sp.]|uniref:hypothetical protein n=1 Tax=Bradyrhizobium sp. TaxID=376 RepID=UPI003C56BE07